MTKQARDIAVTTLLVAIVVAIFCGFGAYIILSVLTTE